VTSRAFFLGSLGIPPVLGAVGYLVPRLDFLLYLFAIGSIPYAVTALVLGMLIWRAQSARAFIRLLMLAPAIFGALFALFLALADQVTGSPPDTHESLPQAFSVVVVGAVYSVPVVCAAWLLWVIFKTMGWVTDDIAT